jgi:metallophosphoesterase (TIGR00282 family)
MKILFIGDISAKPGRNTVKEVLPKIKEKYKPDLVIANCDNAAGGIGVNKSSLDELQGYGIDYFTGGDHVWAIKSFREELYDITLPLVRAYNYEGTDKLPGKFFDIIDLGSKGRVAIITLLGQSFMHASNRNPFWAIDELLETLHKDIDFPKTIILDFHAETTSEKLCLGNYLKDRITALVGTHTHVPTCDNRIIGNMAYVTDVGMVGSLDSSLWVDFEIATHNLKYPYRRIYEPEEEGKMVFNSVLITEEDGKATKIERIDVIN